MRKIGTPANHFAVTLAGIQTEVKSCPAAGELHIDQLENIARKEGVSHTVGDRAKMLIQQIRSQPESC